MTTFSASSVTPAVSEAASRLIAAQATATPCEPVRELLGVGDVTNAYAVQECVTAERLKRGARIVGKKIGLTSEVVQKQLGVDQPDFGTLFDDMAFVSGETVPRAAVLQPKVEAEIAFVLAEDLDTGSFDIATVRAAVDYAVAAIEVCGSRIRGWDIALTDTIADNASAGAYVLGSARRTLESFEPRDATMHMAVTGQSDSSGNGEACLGDPLQAVRWLAIQAWNLGSPLRAGEVILSGALGAMRDVAPGSVAIAEISGLGNVSVRMGKDGEES